MAFLFCEDISIESHKQICTALSPDLLSSNESYVLALVLKHRARYEADWVIRCRGVRDINSCMQTYKRAYHDFVSSVVNYPKLMSEASQRCFDNLAKINGVEFSIKRECLYAGQKSMDTW